MTDLRFDGPFGPAPVACRDENGELATVSRPADLHLRREREG